MRNCIYTFKYLCKYRILDGITKPKGLNNWAYNKGNMFLGQGNDSEKVFILKMFEVGPYSAINFIRRMQPRNNFSHKYMIFDHIKQIKDWTTLACRVYDSIIERILAIACCDFERLSTHLQK